MEYIFTRRSLNQSTGKFTSNPAEVTRYLKLPSKKTKGKKGYLVSKDKWVSEVLKQAKSGEVVIYVHGFNTHQNDMIRRQKKIKRELGKQGYRGAVISYDWPSDASIFNYPSDLRDSQKVAGWLVLDGIIPLLEAKPNIKIHILAHSMGCLVVRHGFAKTRNAKVSGNRNWDIERVLFVAADIDVESVSAGNPKSKTLMKRCVQLTNYHSLDDRILQLSSDTYWWKKPRLGHDGAPDNSPAKLVDIYCRKYFATNKSKYGNSASASHKWYFSESYFYRDAAYGLAGKLKPEKFPTRVPSPVGYLMLW